MENSQIQALLVQLVDSLNEGESLVITADTRGELSAQICKDCYFNEEMTPIVRANTLPGVLQKMKNEAID